MKFLVLVLATAAALLAMRPALAQPAIAEVYAKYPAPVGHRQPSVRDVERARSAMPAGQDLNELARQIEGDLRSRLTICRGC